MLAMVEVGCTSARAISPDSGGDEDPCSPFVGLDAVGTVWEYGVLTQSFEGWERSEVSDLSRDLGLASIRTAGTWYSVGMQYAFERVDDYRCVDGALFQQGWTATWEISDGFGTSLVAAGATLVWESGIKLFDPDVDAGESWPIEDTFTVASSTGTVSTGSWGLDMEVQPTEVLELLDTAVVTRPVEMTFAGVYGTGYGDDWDGKHTYAAIWYAEDIGIVQRNGLVIESFTPGMGVTTN